MPNIEEEVGRLLLQQGLTLSTVESASGGLISHRITNIPGSSNYYNGSIIAYSNEAKIKVAGVKEKTIRKHGAVSAEVARQMAEGGRKLLRTDICLSDTGIAGPGGATPEKPVGLFYIGLSFKEETISRRYIFQGSREENKYSVAEASFKMIKEHLLESPQEGNTLAERHVVTCFLESESEILILQRSEKVGTYQEKWAGVSGYVEEKGADEQAWIEIAEETGLGRNDVSLVKKGEILETTDTTAGTKWIVHPYLFHVTDRNKIKIDWEHKQTKWIHPQDLGEYETVPLLKETLAQVYQA